METKKKKKKNNQTKKKIFEVSHYIMDRTRHGQHWLTALPNPFILNPFETGTAFISAYCISLYVSADGPFMHIHTGKENIPDNLIHSGSSCNVGAAQQVVLWCLSLVSKISVLISEFCGEKKEHNLENTSLSLSLPLSLSPPDH